MTARRIGSASPFYDAAFAVTPNRARRNQAKLAAVEKLAERWLNTTDPNAQVVRAYRAFGQELLDTLNNNAGEPQP